MAGLRTSLSMTAQMYSGLEPELEGEERSRDSQANVVDQTLVSCWMGGDVWDVGEKERWRMRGAKSCDAMSRWMVVAWRQRLLLIGRLKLGSVSAQWPH